MLLLLLLMLMMLHDGCVGGCGGHEGVAGDVEVFVVVGDVLGRGGGGEVGREGDRCCC